MYIKFFGQFSVVVYLLTHNMQVLNMLSGKLSAVHRTTKPKPTKNVEPKITKVIKSVNREVRSVKRQNDASN